MKSKTFGQLQDTVKTFNAEIHRLEGVLTTSASLRETLPPIGPKDRQYVLSQKEILDEVKTQEVKDKIAKYRVTVQSALEELRDRRNRAAASQTLN
jgi:hypothetical protein